MCDFRIDAADILRDHRITRADLFAMLRQAAEAFDGLLEVTEDGLFVPERARPLTRMIARSFDAYDLSKAGHSSAI